jgi:hypothetical protein
MLDTPSASGEPRPENRVHARIAVMPLTCRPFPGALVNAGRWSQRNGTSRTLHRHIPPRSRTGRTTDPEPPFGVRRGTPGLQRNRPLSRIVASPGSTCSSAEGCGRPGHRQVLPGSPAWTPFPVRVRGVPRRSSRVPPGPAISRDTGRRCPRRRRRVSVPGAARRIPDSPCAGPPSARVHQIKRPLVAINHEGSRSEGLIPLGEAGPPLRRPC